MKITVDGNQDISAAVTNIANNVNVTGTVDATVEVEAGSNNIKLTTHRHAGVMSGLSTTALPIP
jgi:phage baseplate assembly protein gpV